MRRFKQNFAALLGAILLCALLLPSGALAEYTGEITSNCVVLMDADSGSILYEKNADTKAYPASTTKIMTCLLALERIDDLETIVTVGTEVRRFSEANSLMGLQENEQVRVIDLLYGMMLPSGNDAAATLACYMGGSISGFAELMNQKAKELGMDNTHFNNPHGLNDEEHYTTAADMAKLVREAMKNEMLMKIVGTQSYTCPPTNKRSSEKTVTNTNRFLADGAYHWGAVTGMKTGSTKAAKGCLITTAEQDGKRLLTVVLGDSSDGYEARWTESRALLEYGFENLSTLALSSLNLQTPEVQVAGYSRNDAEAGMLLLSFDLSGQTLSGTKEHLDEIRANAAKVTVAITYDKELTAPIFQGDVLGTAALKYGDETLAVVDVVAQRDVLSAGDAALSSQPGGLITDVSRTKTSSGFPWKAILIVLIALLLAGGGWYLYTHGKFHRRGGGMHGRQTGRRSRRSRRSSYSYYVYRGGKKK